MGERVIHLRNGRALRSPRTLGEGSTWCGKKLLGKPLEHEAVETFNSYGSDVHVTIDPSAGSCQRCREAFDAAYKEAFPEGLKPIATFQLGDEADMARARKLLSPDALRQFFSPDGGGLSALQQAIRDDHRDTGGVQDAPQEQSA
jgi:hypothetical protein